MGSAASEERLRNQGHASGEDQPKHERKKVLYQQRYRVP